MPHSRLKSSDDPYPGLRSYKDSEALFFAGRGEDIRECASLLVAARVLVLHGRTGCGKSSFLRAGVKPRVASLDLGLKFPKGFVVIRSTADPMRQLVTRIFRMADDLLTTRDSEYGGMSRFSDPDEMRDELKELGVQFTDDGKIVHDTDRFTADSQGFVDVLSYLARKMTSAPIFVIDQGEEVFTMARQTVLEQMGKEAAPETAPDAKAAAAAKPAAGLVLTNMDIGRNKEAVQFFRFLHRFATHGSRSRIVVSLRTEYKGLFDDRINENAHDRSRKHPGPSLAGFFLKELEKSELMQAILRPTLKADHPDWPTIAADAGVDPEVAPFDAFGFTIGRDVVEDLANKLLGDNIPNGGVLPAMQVACLRLWRQARFAYGAGDGGDLHVDMINLRRLGGIGDQVGEYLVEMVEEVCSVPALAGRVADSTKKWMRALRDLMVKVEADGRAVTRAVSREELQTHLEGSLFSTEQGKNTDVAVVISGMIDDLLSERRDILKMDSEGDLLTLGHDSLALALNKWAVQNPHDSMSMMMRMGMGAVRSPEELRMGDLFLEEDPPHKVTIYAHQDYVWDRHLPRFAERKGFAKRLGIFLETEHESLDALGDAETRPKDWKDLTERIRAKELEIDVQRDNSNNKRVMVAADWGSFPGQAPEDRSVKDKRDEFAYRFSDILITDISVGNQLIGPPDLEVEDANKYLDSVDPSKRADALKALLLISLQKIKDMNGEIFCQDRSGRDLLDFAARCAGDTALREYVLDNTHVLPPEDYDPADPLIARLLSESRARRTGKAKGKGKSKAALRTRFIVGNAYSYAMALQCGFVSYFGTKNLSEYSKMEMERRQTVGYEARKNGLPAPTYADDPIPDLTIEMQKIVSHTIWQLGIQPNKWSSGLNRAMVLRFASVGYYTAEYVRSHMSKYIAYVHELVSRVLAMEQGADADGDIAGAARLTEKAIQGAIQECFSFLRFDDYGTEVYDLDARLAYWSDHGALSTKSVAGEIYAELVRLRQRTIENFGLTAQAIAWMRVSKSYRPGNDRVSKAYRLKELAWNNFRILNFYDSDRYMSQAAHLLQEEMEGVFRDGVPGGVADSSATGN